MFIDDREESMSVHPYKEGLLSDLDRIWKSLSDSTILTQLIQSSIGDEIIKKFDDDSEAYEDSLKTKINGVSADMSKIADDACSLYASLIHLLSDITQMKECMERERSISDREKNES